MPTRHFAYRDRANTPSPRGVDGCTLGLRSTYVRAERKEGDTVDAHTRSEVSRRLRCVEGHLRGVLRMVETDQPCMAILHQVQAVQGSLKQINTLLLDSHLEHCLRHVGSATSEESHQQLRVELVRLFSRKEAEE